MIVINYLMILLAVAFLTLFERKVLSLSQIRLGPNKMTLLGILQPIMDGVKLMKKTHLINVKAHEFLYHLVGILIIFFSLMIWISIPYSSWMNKVLVPMYMLALFGVMSYLMLLLGWASMSNYGLIGGNRSLAQVLSFEMIITLTILVMFVLKSKMSHKFTDFNSISMMLFLSLIFILAVFLETHRAPMDMAEGESELVSGYNIEFNSVLFITIFLAEYSMILFLTMMYFMLWYSLNFTVLFMLLLIIIARSCFPRIRYDQIMKSMWFVLLPLLVILWFWLMNMKL